MITVDLKGANDALETFAGLIVPWRRQNAERKSRLELTQKQAEIHRFNAETLMAEAKAKREHAATELDNKQGELIVAQARKTEAEASLILAQAQKAIAEVEKEKAILRKAQIELAFTIIERYAPNLNDIEKMDYVINRLLPVLDKLITSEIEPQFSFVSSIKSG